MGDLGVHKNFKTLSGSDAQQMIFYLVNQFAPNYAHPPKFEPVEIHQLFQVLRYPYQIRNDAITAVGAPSSISFLMKAIYWLFLIAKIYYMQVTNTFYHFILYRDYQFKMIMPKKRSRKRITKSSARLTPLTRTSMK